MASLTFEQIGTILRERPNKGLLDAADTMRKKLSVHINGVGLASYLEQIETYERPEALRLRKKYAKSNVDLFDRLARPVDKVFSARGGSRYYKLSTVEQEKEFTNILLNVEDEYSSKKWIETFWKPRYFDDPMGLIFVEIGEGTAYPTYKSSKDIYDYKLDGRKVEYVVFRTKEPDIFRVVDDMFDATYRVEGETVTKVGTTYFNFFGYVPGLVISDIPKAGDREIFVSPFSSVIELADEYLRDGSVRTVYKFKQGFPKTWKYREVCGDCKGTGTVAAQICTPCNGTGKKLDSSVAEVMVLDWPTSGEPVIAPNVGGFITPDLEYLKYAREELQTLETLMCKTHWGTTQVDATKTGNPETATGRFIDAQPVNDKLNAYASAAEAVEEFIVNALGEFYFTKAYSGCSITYGRRFIIEGPDVIWNKYESARKLGAPFSTLDEHLREYYESKFEANSVELHRHLRLMRIEPFVHLTVDQAAAVIGGVELARKVYFSEWVGAVPPGDWLVKSDKEMKASLTAFAKSRYTPAEPITKPDAQPIKPAVIKNDN